MELTQHTFFSLLKPEDAQTLSSTAKLLSFKDKEYIFREGDKADGMYLVLSGTVLITKQNQNGENTILAQIYEDDYFGEFAILDGNPRSASVMAWGDVKVALLLASDVLTCLREIRSSFGLINNIISKIRSANEKHAEERQKQIRLQVAGELTSTILEKFRSSFTALYMFTEMVQQKAPELAQASLMAQEKIDYISSLSQEIQGFSAESTDLKLSRFSVNDILTSLIEESRIQLTSAGAQLHYDETELWLFADQDKINRAFQFLLSLLISDLKGFSGEIRIKTQASEDETKIIFESAKGSSKSENALKKDIHHNFNPDFDLAIARSVFMSHGGKLTKETTPTGLKFTSVLPKKMY